MDPSSDGVDYRCGTWRMRVPGALRRASNRPSPVGHHCSPTPPQRCWKSAARSTVRRSSIPDTASRVSTVQPATTALHHGAIIEVRGNNGIVRVVKIEDPRSLHGGVGWKGGRGLGGYRVGPATITRDGAVVPRMARSTLEFAGVRAGRNRLIPLARPGLLPSTSRFWRTAQQAGPTSRGAGTGRADGPLAGSWLPAGCWPA